MRPRSERSSRRSLARTARLAAPASRRRRRRLRDGYTSLGKKDGSGKKDEWIKKTMEKLSSPSEPPYGQVAQAKVAEAEQVREREREGEVERERWYGLLRDESGLLCGICCVLNRRV